MKRLFAFTTSVMPFFLRKLRKQVKANSPICLHRTLLEIKTLAISLHLLPSLAFARNKLEINEKGVLAEAKRQKQKTRGIRAQKRRSPPFVSPFISDFDRSDIFVLPKTCNFHFFYTFAET